MANIVNHSDKTDLPTRDANPIDTSRVQTGKEGRPWSKRATIFQNGSKLSFGKALMLLGLLPFYLSNSADQINLAYQSPNLDVIWNQLNAKFNLPRGFLEKHDELDLVERADERLLPK